ncbi:DUF2637 domain-containing protein [Streptomyces sp. NPDC047072]|uniref:DUF2637 domain-containing protein n=1 Tax=Streptomyces sp. NPDC047072 TaxID=3154809 RepID=UPI0033E88214
MNASSWALPAGLAVAGIGSVVAVGMVLGNRRRAQEQNASAEERAQLAHQRRQAWQRRLAVIALAIGCVMMFVLAGIAAWLSFGAQRDYAHAHNGGDWDAATGFALLLDAGALSLSLIRFFEALTLRSSAITRILLLAFVSASAAMNMFDAPEAGTGSAFLAMVPPLVYAVLLEMLLYKVEQVIMGRQKRRKAGQDRGYSLLLWLPWPIGAPVKMWKAWRTELLSTVSNVRVTGSLRPLPTAADPALPASPSAGPAELPPPTAANGAPPPSATAVGTGQAPVSVATAPTAGPQPAVGQRPPASVPAAPAPPTPTPTPAPVTAAAAAVALSPAAQEHGVPSPAAAGSAERAADAEPVRVGHRAEPDSDSEPGAGPAPRETQEDPTGAQDDAQSDAVGEAPEDEGDDAQDGAAGETAQTGHDEQTGDEPEAEEPDTEHGHASSDGGDDEVRDERRVQIDLTTLPKDETPRQLAERIYVAHQVAGLPLNRADLGRWAGYTNPRSGGNEYRRLEKEYGPILERKGAAYVDLDWSSLDQHTPAAASSSEPGEADEDRQPAEQAQAA